MRYFDDLSVGDRLDLGAYVFDADSIKTFARAFDPQPFHLDEAAARASHFGGLCASGWHTAAVWMKLMVAAMKADDEARRARGEDIAPAGPSPGFRDMKWLKPVYAGDTIHYESAVTLLRRSVSQKGWGLMESLNTGRNQNGENVFAFTGLVFVPCREAGEAQ